MGSLENQPSTNGIEMFSALISRKSGFMPPGAWISWSSISGQLLSTCNNFCYILLPVTLHFVLISNILPVA